MDEKTASLKVAIGQKNHKGNISVGYHGCGEKCQERLTEWEILILVEGRAVLSDGNGREQAMHAGMMVFLSPGGGLLLSFPVDSVTIRVDADGLEGAAGRLFTGDDDGTMSTEGAFPTMDMKPEIRPYVDSVLAYHGDGIDNPSLHGLKARELFILLGEYHTERELAVFFRNGPGPNPGFSSFVLGNYRQVRTVKEFAQRANVSLSGFEKEFRRAFGTSPYRWMKQKRMEHLLSQISRGDKPLKVICEDCGFSSASQMNDFCKKEWGITPGKLRSGKL